MDWAVASETGAILQYNKWALECSAHADSTTKKLFEQLVGDEERHFSQFDDELANMAKFGPNYLALQSIERSKATSMLPLNRPGGGGTAG